MWHEVGGQLHHLLQSRASRNPTLPERLPEARAALEEVDG